MNQRRAAVFLPLLLVFAVFFSRLLACSTQNDEEGLPDSDGGISHVVQTGCGSPAQGCPCSGAGTTVACGQVDLTRDGFNQCSYGTLTCTDKGTWSACEGAVRVQSLLSKPSDRIHAQDLQLEASTCGDADPCDPYCSGYSDTPTGISPLPTGLTIADGGLTLVPNTDGGVVPGAVQTTSNGLSSCGAMLNTGVGGCSAPGPTACAQDFRCDTDSHTCVWNGGEGYHDNSIGGADLTVGTACGIGSTTTFPVCNRGSLPVPESTPLNVYFVPGNSAPSGCTPISGPVTCSEPAPSGGLAPGACLNVPCAIGGGGGFAVVNAGDPSMLEATGWCANNVAFAQTSDDPDGGSDAGSTCATCQYCDTTLTGVVDDPRKNVGLRDITVYELAGTAAAPPALTDNVGGATPPPCDTCDSLLPPSTYSVATNTDNMGSFTLDDVTPGPHQVIVAQTGRWRRAATMNITACAANTIDADAIRLPASKSEGDIPKIALVMGAAESLECWLRKMGIADTEMTPYTGPGDTQRIQLFSEGGMTYGGPTPLLNADGNLWGTTSPASSGAINEYSALVLSCDGTDFSSEGSGPMGAITSYANAGGRLFMDHFYGDTWLVENGSPWNTSAVSNWVDPSDWYSGPEGFPFCFFDPGAYCAPAQGKVLDGTTAQQHMHDWLGQWAPYTPGPGVGWLESDNPRLNALDQGSASTTWVRGDNRNHFSHHHPDGNYSLSFSFETPVGDATTCGRVLFNGMHASQTRSPIDPYTSVVYGSFPSDCDLSEPLTSEETALEYQLFQVTACALGGAPPPSPPPLPPALSSVTFTRDFHAECGDGLKLVWQAFNWEANLPPGTSIHFYAATAPDNPDGGAPSLPASVTAAPATVPIGNATLTTLAPQWGTDENTVDWHLEHDLPGPPQTSEAWLRVYMVFAPTATMAPTLYDWQQLYDCVPDQ